MKITSSNEKVLLSTLWIFATLNYLYCDVLGLMDHNILGQILKGSVDGVEMSENFLLGASFLMEIPIAMVLVSRIVKYRINRIANVIAGTIMTLVQIGSLLIGTTTIYYRFFSAIEIATTVFVVWFAWKWKESEE